MCNKHITRIYGLFHYTLLNSIPQCITKIKCTPFTRGIYHTLPYNLYVSKRQLQLLGIKDYPENGKIKMIIMPQSMPQKS